MFSTVVLYQEDSKTEPCTYVKEQRQKHTNTWKNNTLAKGQTFPENIGLEKCWVAFFNLFYGYALK